MPPSAISTPLTGTPTLRRENRSDFPKDFPSARGSSSSSLGSWHSADFRELALQFVKGEIQSADLVRHVLAAGKVDTIFHFAAQVLPLLCPVTPIRIANMLEQTNFNCYLILTQRTPGKHGLNMCGPAVDPCGQLVWQQLGLHSQQHAGNTCAAGSCAHAW